MRRPDIELRLVVVVVRREENRVTRAVHTMINHDTHDSGFIILCLLTDCWAVGGDWGDNTDCDDG